MKKILLSIFMVLGMCSYAVGADLVLADVKFREQSNYVDYCEDAEFCLRMNGTENNSLLDESGNDNHCSNEDASYTTTDCKESGCYSFNGTTSLIRCGRSSILDDMTAISISLWAVNDSEGEGENGLLINKRFDGDGGTGGWDFWEGSAANTNVIQFTVDHATTDLKVITDNNAWVTSELTHFLVTWDGSTTASNVHIYINGVEATYQTQIDGVGARVSDSSKNIIIGNSSGSKVRTHDGTIDEVIIREEVLSQAEVTNIYQNGLR